MHVDGAGVAVAALPEEARSLFAGAVVLAIVVDREHEVPATVEVTATGRLKVDSALDEDLENVDDAARVGHRAGTRAAGS